MTGSSSACAAWRLRHIIVGTDFTSAGEQALARAARLTRERGAQLTLAHIVPASLWEDLGTQVAGAVGITVSPQDAQRTAAERLQRRAAELFARDGLTCNALVSGGRPAQELARIASDTAADLVVVGAKGEHPVRSLMLGTTAQKLLRVTNSPVLVVKRGPPLDYARVLAPTDFSAPARCALEATAALLPQARLHVAHAFELPYDGLMRFAGVDDAAVAQYHAAAHERLTQQLVEWTDAAGVPPPRRTLHVEHGHAPTRIDDWIKSTRADLVVIAAHGKSELESTLLGSVSLRTVLTAPCDVLLFRGAMFG
jgi:nucleotide-binding universal stress UspA family protein